MNVPVIDVPDIDIASDAIVGFESHAIDSIDPFNNPYGRRGLNSELKNVSTCRIAFLPEDEKHLAPGVSIATKTLKLNLCNVSSSFNDTASTKIG